MISLFKNDYWDVSKKLPLGLLFITPLWILYEYFAYLLNQGFGGRLRTGLDYLVKQYLVSLKLPLEVSLILPALIVIVYLLKKPGREVLAQARIVYFAGMFVESIAYAAVLGLIIGHFVQIILMSSGLVFDTTKTTALMINVGAGLYEEFVFRLGLMSLALFVFRHYGARFSYPIAATISAVAFALFHYLGFFEEVFALNTFLFRVIAGACFSVLFLWRGIGITVYTHSFYNIFLMLR